jgi:hypothetical protein
MAWDSTRPVPWNRLVREWLIYAAIMAAVFLIFFRGDNVVGAIAGVLISGPLYLAFGAAMAKFGYQRTRLKDVRNTANSSSGAAESTTATPAGEASRGKPAPTSRTAGGGNRPKSSSRRKR